MVYHLHFGWNKKGLTPLTVITNIIKHSQVWWKQEKEGVNQHLQWFTAKNKNRETASCPRVRTKITLILEFKNTFWHHLHRKVICDLPERVWACVCTHVRVCACVCVCVRESSREAEYLNVRVLFLQLVLPVHHGYGCLTELRWREKGEKLFWCTFNDDNHKYDWIPHWRIKPTLKNGWR